MLRIQWFGQVQETESSSLKLSILTWTLGVQRPSQPESFGTHGSCWEWVFLLGKLLGKEGKVSLVNRCFMRKQEESIDHLLLYCAIAGLLWQLVFSLFGLQWVMCSSVRMMLLSWNGAQVGKKWQKAWLTALLCLF